MIDPTQLSKQFKKLAFSAILDALFNEFLFKEHDPQIISVFYANDYERR